MFQRKKNLTYNIKWKSEKSATATEVVNIIISEWPHGPVRQNKALYQVVVLHVNTFDGEIAFKNHLPALHVCVWCTDISINTT